jgi:hypothetical protein
MAGQSKSRRTTPAPAGRPAKRATRGALLNLDAEQQARVLLIGGVALVVIVALAFVGLGYYFSVIKPRGRTVLQVDDVKVSYSDMRRRMEYEFFQNAQYQQAPQILPSAALVALEDELTLVKRAESSLGLTIDQAEFDERFNTKIGAPSNADQRAFADALRQALEAAGLNEEEYRRLVRAEILEEKAKEKFRLELPANVEQARVEVITVQEREEADAVIARLNAGEEFAAVAREVSLEPDAATTGGVHEFAPRGSYPDAYADYAFTAPPGQLSGPLQALSGGFYIVRVLERSEQPVSEDQKPQLVNERYEEWLNATQQEMETSGALVRSFDEDDQVDALTAVLGDAAPRLEEQQREQLEQQQRAQEAQQTAIAQLTQSPSVAPTEGAPGATTPPAGGGTPAADATAPAADATAPAAASTPAVPTGPVAP